MRRIELTGRGRLTRSVGAVLGLSVLCAAGGGCQNKVYDENVKLRDQNRELQARLDERGSTPPVAPVALPEPVRPAPAPVAPDLPRAVAPPAPEPARPTPPAPAGPPDADLTGPGLETTTDAVAGTTTVNIGGDALFDPGQVTIKQSAKASLDKVVSALKKQYAGKPVHVQGHTDSDPIRRSKWASNMELSRARADAVKAYLVSKGVEASRVTAEGFGESKPKDTATTLAAKAKNRRVEIVVSTR